MACGFGYHCMSYGFDVKRCDIMDVLYVDAALNFPNDLHSTDDFNITDYFSQLVNHNMSIQIIWCVRRGCNSSWGNGISFLLRRSTAVNCGKSLTTLCTILGTGNGSINRHCRRHRLSSSSLLSIHNYIIIMTPQSDNDSGPCNSIKFYLHANNNNNHQRNHNK